MKAQLDTPSQDMMMTTLISGVRGYRKLGLDFGSDTSSLLFLQV